MYTVYLITNNVNSKKYVGVTIRSVEERYREHIREAESGSRWLLHCAMRKYGSSNFSLDVLEVDVPDEDAGDRERYYIQFHNTYYVNGYGYNMTLGGNGTVGYVFTDEAKQKISNSMKGHVFSPERNAKVRAAMLGREYKQEWRDALSAARLGRFKGPDNPFFGRKHKPETKKAVSDANTRYAILQIDPKTLEVIREFKNAPEAGKWVVANGYSSALPTTCECRISEVCRKNNLNLSAYTFKWKYKEGQSTNR